MSTDSRKRNTRRLKIEHLLSKGVRIANPDSVEIGDDVDPQRISGDNVVIHCGCKIFGRTTLILQGTELGYEAPVTIEDCQLGPQARLKGGFFSNAVFLNKASAGSGSHVREGTVLEEQAGIAHTVGLKHTILFPFVTLGSLINFCDCLMAGGTSRKNHSEVGSSYIHFNFTPNQDKATASLIGDVPRGVMLNQAPIFLGGQGGLVGPCRLAYGTTVAAGTIVRKDELRPNRLLFGGVGQEGNISFTPGRYRNEKRVILNNIVYIANLLALRQWYLQVRTSFLSDTFPEALWLGLKDNVDRAIKERIDRLRALCRKNKPPDEESRSQAELKKVSRKLQQAQELYNMWPRLEAVFETQREYAGDPRLNESFLERILHQIKISGKDYIAVIQGLDPADTETGTRWLQGIVDETTTKATRMISFLKSQCG